MSFHVLLSQLAEIIAAGSVNLSDDLLAADVAGITTDTRTLKAGEVFVALRGEKFDGHEFVETALRKGAIAVITDYKMPGAIPQLHVKDTLTAYQAIARWWRSQFKIPVIGITGSCGKTTTKELVSAVLSSTKGNTHKTLFNYNNEIGVPKTLLEMSPIHDYAVLKWQCGQKVKLRC
jgi:UDP-N-acetylmuramoyl-tripeptide--D-alanyl-D-alanine ligase